MASAPTYFVSYKKRHCTDVLCLVLFFVFILIYVFIATLAVSQGNPASLIQPSDSMGDVCGKNEFEDKPYEFYFDISKCLTDSGLAFLCPTTKLCVSSCPNKYSHYQSLQAMESNGLLSKSLIRKNLICIYGLDPAKDNRTIVQLVDSGLCAPYTLESKPFLGRCFPSIFINLFDTNDGSMLQVNTSSENSYAQIFGVNSLSDVGRIILGDLDRIKESLALFILIGCILTLLYMFAVKELTGLVVTISIFLFLVILFICSSYCWYTIYTGNDLVYEYSLVARIVDGFIKLKTIYKIFGCITTFALIVSLFVICTLFDRIRLSVILLDQGATAVFSVLSTLLWSPFIVIIYFLLILAILYIQMCLSTVGRPIFLMTENNQSVPCLPNANSTECIFQQDFGYNSLLLNDTDRVTRGVIEFLVDYKPYLQWLNMFALLWFGAFLFAFEEIVLAGVFSNFYWSQEQLTTFFPLGYSLAIVLRYHIGSIAFGSLLIATLRFIRMLLDYISEKLSKIHDNVIMKCIAKCMSCFLWLFEKFLKFLNKNSYVLIASRGYSFCKATRKAFGYLVANCLRFAVLVHLTEWILFCGMVSVCSCNGYLFYRYLQWTKEYDELILRWAPIVAIILITYLITSLFFSVYDMAIKTIFVCFLQDLDENDGSIQHPYVMNNELLSLVHKTNVDEKK